MPISLPNAGTITEAQFEAHLRAALLHAFPWLPGSGLTHQRSFTFRFGHASVTVAGDARSYSQARADVLVRFNNRPLAIFELKRPGLTLTEEDDEQGLSYARMLHPRPPLVVVSNGRNVRLLETHSGEPWVPQTPSESDLAALVSQGTQVAEADLKRAVETLMGSASSIWVQAIRQVTGAAIEELTGSWDEPLAPFVRDFLLPREAAEKALASLSGNKRLSIVEGEPLAGKSNALRQIARALEQQDDGAFLYLDADGGLDLFGCLSLILSDSLGWPVTAEEARNWLVKLSKAGGPQLVLGIDNLGPDRDDLRRDLEALTSNLFGPALRIVLATDDTVAEQLTRARSGRGLSTLGRRGARFRLGPLSNAEFAIARHHLAVHNLTFVEGAQHSEQLRTPWLIRAMMADAVSSPQHRIQKLAAALSPVPGLELIDHARRAFDVSQMPFARYRELAEAVLEDAQDRSRPFELVLELLHSFIVRRQTVLRHLENSEISEMQKAGLIREARSHSGENIVVVRLPELMASELAQLLAEELPGKVSDDAVAAADWLAGAASNLPLGDVITAQALIDTALRQHGIGAQLIAELRRRAPSRGVLAADTRAVTLLPGAGIVEVPFGDDDPHGDDVAGEEEAENATADDDATIEDLHPYLILSHLAGHASEAVRPDGGTARVDPDLLVGVGSSPILLKRPGGNPLIAAVPVHQIADDLTIVCHLAGIVEPITWSLVRFFGREDGTIRDQFIEYALNEVEPALLPRLDVALRQTALSADRRRAAWAAQVRKDRIKPLLQGALEDYFHA